jgi:hypothetical protein
MWRNFVAIALILGFSACTRHSDVPGDPKSRLSEYISRSFTVKAPADRQELLSFLTGDAKVRLEAWSDDQFSQAFMSTKRQFLKLAIREMKPLSDAQINITYEVTYLDQGKGHNAKVTTKKLCEMSQVDGKWFIDDVRNIKELVEYQDELSLP